MPSNKKRKIGKGKDLATTLEKLGAEVKQGRFDALVTPAPISSHAKGGVEQDWDLEGLEELESEGELRVEGNDEGEESLATLVGCVTGAPIQYPQVLQ